MELIDKSAVKAEIDGMLKKEYPCDNSEQGTGYSCALYELQDFLNTLEVKEVENFIWNNARTTVPEDSTNQIICIKEDGLAVSTIGKIVNGTVKWAYLDDLLNTNSFNVEVKEVNLEKESLTWEDIRELYIIFAEVDVDIELCKTADIQAETIGYYQEVLKRFKAQKGE